MSHLELKPINLSLLKLFKNPLYLYPLYILLLSTGINVSSGSGSERCPLGQGGFGSGFLCSSLTTDPLTIISYNMYTWYPLLVLLYPLLIRTDIIVRCGSGSELRPSGRCGSGSGFSGSFVTINPSKIKISTTPNPLPLLRIFIRTYGNTPDKTTLELNKLYFPSCSFSLLSRSSLLPIAFLSSSYPVHLYFLSCSSGISVPDLQGFYLGSGSVSSTAPHLPTYLVRIYENILRYPPYLPSHLQYLPSYILYLPSCLPFLPSLPSVPTIYLPYLLSNPYPVSLDFLSRSSVISVPDPPCLHSGSGSVSPIAPHLPTYGDILRYLPYPSSYTPYLPSTDRTHLHTYRTHPLPTVPTSFTYHTYLLTYRTYLLYLRYLLLYIPYPPSSHTVLTLLPTVPTFSTCRTYLQCGSGSELCPSGRRGSGSGFPCSSVKINTSKIKISTTAHPLLLLLNCIRTYGNILVKTTLKLNKLYFLSCSSSLLSLSSQIPIPFLSTSYPAHLHFLSRSSGISVPDPQGFHFGSESVSPTAPHLPTYIIQTHENILRYLTYLPSYLPYLPYLPSYLPYLPSLPTEPTIYLLYLLSNSSPVHMHFLSRSSVVSVPDPPRFHFGSGSVSPIAPLLPTYGNTLRYLPSYLLYLPSYLQHLPSSPTVPTFIHNVPTYYLPNLPSTGRTYLHTYRTYPLPTVPTFFFQRGSGPYGSIRIRTFGSDLPRLVKLIKRMSSKNYVLTSSLRTSEQLASIKPKYLLSHSTIHLSPYILYMVPIKNKAQGHLNPSSTCCSVWTILCTWSCRHMAFSELSEPYTSLYTTVLSAKYRDRPSRHLSKVKSNAIKINSLSQSINYYP